MCFYLITGLQVATWVRYGIWFAVGILIYAFYGFHRSQVKPPIKAGVGGITASIPEEACTSRLLLCLSV